MQKNQMMRQFLHKSLILHDICKSSGWKTWHARHIISQPIAIGEIEAIQKTGTHRKRWQPHETQVLIAAKKEVESVISESGSRRKRKRWEDIEIFCQTKGVERTAQQCKERWDRLMILYSQIRSWENSRNAERLSFWSMDMEERKSNGFLMGLDQESYIALDEFCSKEGMVDVVAEDSLGTERKVEDGDDLDDFQVERDVLAEARLPNIHDEGELIEKAGFTPNIDANGDYVLVTTDNSNVEYQKMERKADVVNISTNPTKGMSNGITYIGVDRTEDDNELTRMYLTHIEDHIEVVELHTMEKHIKTVGFCNASDTINLSRNYQSAEEEVDFRLQDSLSHYPVSEYASGESSSTVDHQCDQASQGLSSPGNMQTEDTVKSPKPCHGDFQGGSFSCVDNNSTSKQLSNRISLQEGFHHYQEGESVSDKQIDISSHGKDAEVLSNEVNIAKNMPVEGSCKEVSLDEDGNDFKPNSKQFEEKETYMSDKQVSLHEERSCAKNRQKIVFENEMEKGVICNKGKLQGVDAPFCYGVTENVCGNESVNRIEEVSYKGKVPDKLSMEPQGDLGGSSTEVGSDTCAKFSKSFEKSKEGNEARKQTNAAKTTTDIKNGEWDDDIILYMQTSFANLVKFVSHAITRVFKG